MHGLKQLKIQLYKYLLSKHMTKTDNSILFARKELIGLGEEM